MVKLLLAHGAKVIATAADDMTAIHFAAQKGHTECVRQLLHAGEAGLGFRVLGLGFMFVVWLTGLRLMTGCVGGFGAGNVDCQAAALL